MVSQVASYYTTNEPYRNVASNHLSKIKYDEDSLTLWITFANNACYKYWGVPKNLYKGLMASPSHGVFFWENIRQRFPYKLVGSAKDNGSDILATLSKGHKKLNELDKLEKLAKSQLERGIIDYEKYESIVDLLEKQREKAGELLDKELGVYVSPAEKRREEALKLKEAKALEKHLQECEAVRCALLEQNRYARNVNTKKFAMGAVIAATVVFTFSHILVGLIVLGILVEQYRKIR